MKFLASAHAPPVGKRGKNPRLLSIAQTLFEHRDSTTTDLLLDLRSEAQFATENLRLNLQRKINMSIL